MSFVCNICNTLFSRKQSLERHWTNRNCKIEFKELSELIENYKNNNNSNSNVKSKINTETHNGDKITNVETQIVNNNININIIVNPVSKLNTKYMDTDKLKQFIYKYDDMTVKTPEKLNILLSGYIKDIICNSEHPENHAIKYTKIRPPTYSCKVEDVNGESIDEIKNLKDTCELLTDPLLLTLKRKLRVFLSKYEKDDKDDFDYGLYDTAIDKLRKEFNNINVRKALSSVLQNEILCNIDMKFKYTFKKALSE